MEERLPRPTQAYLDNLTSSFQPTAGLVDVHKVARTLNCKTMAYDFGTEISGCIVKHNANKICIGYNEKFDKITQKFTIAHCLGHRILHFDNSNDSDFFAESNFMVRFKSTKPYTEKEKRQELEASYFALSLLIPTHDIVKLISSPLNILTGEDILIKQVAKIYQVHEYQMVWKLSIIFNSNMLLNFQKNNGNKKEQ